ncbi:MAG: type II toxin-antitoxin system RelE/ParE family toxin, partial [Holophagales bacterium]|nr:type II toxin-antitoxin system RelE/ParE family toxin [Holophagales bacterium]
MNGENWQFLRYRDKNGNDPVWDFLQKQMNDAERSQVAARMQMVMKRGMLAVNGDIVENLGKNLYAMRIPNTLNNPRIFMCNLSKLRPKCFVMLHAYRKHTEEIPEPEIRIARKKLKEVQDDPNQYIIEARNGK